MSVQRTMLQLDAGRSRFQLRAAALIRRNGYLLVHRAVSDPFYALPGGRVEMGESGAEALRREIGEEMGVGARVGSLRLIIENFFELGGRAAHEMGLYYDAELMDEFPFHPSDIVHRNHEGGTELEFRWVAVSADALTQLDLKPVPLRSLIEEDGPGVVHVVYADQQRETAQ
jgi:8-oxo-dGTP pyrophosphatase MutT (NUDIX family)